MDFCEDFNDDDSNNSEESDEEDNRKDRGTSNIIQTQTQVYY